MTYRQFCQVEDVTNEFTIDLYDKKEKIGVLKIKTRYEYGEIKKTAKAINTNGLSALWKGCSSVKYEDSQIMT